ncbi:TolC family protein [Dyadobacter sp. CY345]|uniref:TolC family protein n=1 Tax=Dyadobacter sp. CY345 TaxID=2909335 RepID=UPI001F23E3E0|nr:TolC family protein [Dyadobacter sp. CY345]MCF2447641.1 TolC family protein [Dyadobacter sp. CY345]
MKFNLKGKCMVAALTFMLLSLQARSQDQTFSLKGCIQYTLRHHPNTAIYKYAAQSAAEKIRESKASFLPSVSGSVGLDYNLKLQTNVIPAGSFSPTETKLQLGNKFSNSASIQADQNIFDKSASIGIKTSRVNKEVADLTVTKENETLVYNTASSYYQALTYNEKGRLLKESEKQYETMVAILKLRYEQGVVKKSEYDRARVNFNNVQSEILANSNAYKLAINTLKNHMGLELEASITIGDSINNVDVNELSLPKNNDLDGNNLIDYQIDQKNLELKNLDLLQKKAAFLPTFSIYAKYGGNAFGTEFGPALTQWYDYSVVGVKATIPIFSGFKKQSQVTQSQFSFKLQQLTNKLNLQTYKLNVENAATEITSTYVNLKKNKENLTLAKEMMDASTVEYKEGTTTLSSLLDADYSYKEARTNYTTTLLDYLNAQLSYYKNTGTISQFVNELK